METRELEGKLIGNPGSSLVFNPFLSDDEPPLTTRPHPIDVHGAQASPLPAGAVGTPTFAPFRISLYLFRINPFDSQNEAEQLQVHAPDLPMSEQCTAPF